MNSNKSHCPWCNSKYASWGAYSNHLENKHPDKVGQTFTTSVRQQTNIPQHTEAQIEQSGPVLTYEGYGSRISDNDEDDLGQDIDEDDLGRIQ
ncbi:hypothetical protein BGX38DRAFT_1272490 [Terfezia claveryi]|nr:hypothetical protein BGX38DRAFT_1272490 [Terfezia claveryi]